MDRVFLDANVLFSAAYSPGNVFLELWRRKGVRLLTSEYVVQEATRNLVGVERLKRLKQLVAVVQTVPGGAAPFPHNALVRASLPEKDRPVLTAAIAARATHLLTGDRRHFGKFFGKRVCGVLIQTPIEYLHQKSAPPQGA